MKNPPDTSICGQKKDKDDPMNFIQVKTTTKKGNNYRYRKLRYGIDTWGGFKSGGFVKRDYLEDGFDTQEEYEAALNEELNWEEPIHEEEAGYVNVYWTGIEKKMGKNWIGVEWNGFFVFSTPPPKVSGFFCWLMYCNIDLYICFALFYVKGHLVVCGLSCVIHTYIQMK